MPDKKSSGTADSSRAPAEPACDTTPTQPAAPARAPADTQPAGSAPASPPLKSVVTVPTSTAGSVTRGAPAPTPRSVPPAAPRAADPFLGHAQAVLIACKCANTIPANLARTLSELGVNGIPFQQAVRTAVNAAGYVLGAAEVPGAPGTRLIQVVTIIQNARRAI